MTSIFSHMYHLEYLLLQRGCKVPGNLNPTSPPDNCPCLLILKFSGGGEGQQGSTLPAPKYKEINQPNPTHFVQYKCTVT